MKRRKFITSLGMGLAAAAILPVPGIMAAENSEWWKVTEHTFPPLPYGLSALEPFIDTRTVDLHYNKHHLSYYTKFVEAIKGTPLENQHILKIFTGIDKSNSTIRNMGGGYYNHTIYWQSISPSVVQPSDKLKDAIEKSFGSMEQFLNQFGSTAASVFGSGWVWLIVTPKKELKIVTSANQDNPVMNISAQRGYPLLALDVWEHAYYLLYQNRRKDYIDAVLKHLNWKFAEKSLDEAENIWLKRLF